MSWWEDICKVVPARTVVLLVTPYDLSWMNKARYAKVRLVAGMSDLYFRQLALIEKPPADVLCSRAVAKGHVIALVEE